MIASGLSDAAKHATDKATVGSLAAAWVVDHTSLFTGIAAILTVIWFAIRIAESETFAAIVFKTTGLDLVAWRATRSGTKKNTTGKTENEF